MNLKGIFSSRYYTADIYAFLTSVNMQKSEKKCTNAKIYEISKVKRVLSNLKNKIHALFICNYEGMNSHKYLQFI